MRDVNRDIVSRFTALRVGNDAEKGRAPHKPHLLLAVLDLLEAGQLGDGWVTLSPDRSLRFRNCSSPAPRAPGLRHPFALRQGQAAVA